MQRRELLKTAGFGAIGLAGIRWLSQSKPLSAETGASSLKNWAWVTTDIKASDREWRKKFAGLYKAGIRAVLPEVFNNRCAYYASSHLPVESQWLERILPIAKFEGLEVHAWMHTMPCNIESVIRDHPEWFMVNGKGESCIAKPAYVDYYKFLCPSRPEVAAFLEKRIAELAQFDALDGIHLDYIRYPDVIIAKALQPKYGIVQDREYPEYDYCYCDVCRKKFNDQTGIDPLLIGDPSADAAWRRFRYDSITNLVNNHLIPIARSRNKTVTAAVFPNWENVRQEWFKWNLDAVLPMLYHEFYEGDIDWIENETRKGVGMLSGRIPLYSGLMVQSLNPDEFVRAVQASLKGGAKGVSLFHARSMDKKHLDALKRAFKNQ